MKKEILKKKPTKAEILKTLAEYLTILLGTFLYALGMVYFITPLQFVPGGLTTIGVVVHYLVPALPTGVTVFILNIPLFIVSSRRFGFRFIARTVAATAVLSLFIDVLETLCAKNGWAYSGEEAILGAVFGGVLLGIGTGLVFVSGATTGGVDIMAKLLRLRFPHVSVGKLVLVCDFAVILLAGAVYKSIVSILYSVVIVFLMSLATDYLISGRSHSKMLMILTKYPKEVTADIMELTGRGVTLVEAYGGYTGEAKQMLMCVVRTPEVATVRKIVARYDEQPFIIITDSAEVWGEGFKSHKDTL